MDNPTTLPEAAAEWARADIERGRREGQSGSLFSVLVPAFVAGAKWADARLASTPAVTAEPVAWRHNLTHTLHDTEEEVQLADAESWAEPLYLGPPVHQPCAAPPGWKLVPAEATEAMAVAGVKQMFEDKQYAAPWEEVFKRAYAAMLAAGPSADGVAGDSKPDSGHTT